jgi:CXXX repeat peptide maturase
MLQYLIILLDNHSTAICHYNIPKNFRKRLIDIEDLKEGIRFAMMENLMIQFVYPKDELPAKYIDVINSIDHIDIKPITDRETDEADVFVFNYLPMNLNRQNYPPLIFRLTPREFFDFSAYLVKKISQSTNRVNIVIRDTNPISTWDLNKYKEKLKELATYVEQEYIAGSSTQWNILTDRMMLTEMNNCGAGDNSITLAPNGKFYICPAFYYDDIDDFVGDVHQGLNIPNPHLYKLEYAPICRHCDAYHCKRCIWLNQKMTLEVNTPSHEQCVASHIERNTSMELLEKLTAFGYKFPNKSIPTIDYLDPFENRELWQQENL